MRWIWTKKTIMATIKPMNAPIPPKSLGFLVPFPRWPVPPTGVAFWHRSV